MKFPRTSSCLIAWLIAMSALCVTKTTAREGSSTKSASPAGSHSRSASPNSVTTRGSGARRLDKQAAKRLREGTVISDQAGFFHEDGDGAKFVADSGMEFGALPNLNLERVVRVLKSAEEPDSIRWSVSGEVTEFSSRNYLLLKRAVYKSAAPPPLPERVAVEK